MKKHLALLFGAVLTFVMFSVPALAVKGLQIKYA